MTLCDCQSWVRKLNTASTSLSHLSGHHLWSHEQPWKNSSPSADAGLESLREQTTWDREEFSRSPSCSSPCCLSLSSPGARHASGEVFIMTPAARLSECNHRRESMWEPPIWVQSTPRAVRDNNKWLFLLYATKFGIVWYAAINNQDKLAQAWASLCSMEFKRLSKISAGPWRNRLDCPLWVLSSDALTLTWSPAPIQLPWQKSLTPSIWVSSRLHGKFKVTLLITWALVNLLPLSPYHFPFSPCLLGCPKLASQILLLL